MEQLRVRQSADDDVSEITRIYGHYVQHSTATFELEPPGVDEMTKRRANILALGLPHLVAERGDTILGYAYAGRYRPRPCYQFTIEDSIYIDPQSVGQGCGLAPGL